MARPGRAIRDVRASLERQILAPMDTLPTLDPFTPPTSSSPDAGMTRRGLLRAGVLTGGGLVAVAVAACAKPAGVGWTLGPTASSGAAAVASPSAAPAAPSAAPTAAASAEMSHAPSASAAPPSTDHDANAKAGVDRFLGGEAASYPMGNQPLEPRLENGVKVFELTIDEIEHRIDAVKAAGRGARLQRDVAGPADDRHRGRQGPGDLQEQPQGVDRRPLPRPAAARTRWTACRTSPRSRSRPGGTFTYEFTAKTVGSHMYHSHHNATDQVGRGLLGAFIVQPKAPAERYDRLYGATQDIVWISNDTLGGFTINGRGFPATAPIVAKLGDKIVIRFMNEGVMMHPVAPPRDADAGRRARRLSARGGRVHVRHPGRQPRRALGRRHRLRRARARGPSTATSSRTPKGWTGCTAWSRRWSSRMRRRAVSLQRAGAPAFACVIPTKV